MPTDDTIAQLRAIRTVDLTTTGRRSGRAARIEIWWFHVDDRFLITGTPGKRDWYANVQTDPNIVIHTSVGDFDARVRIILDPVFRRRVFTHPEVGWYRTQTELAQLVAEAPMIEIILD